MTESFVPIFSPVINSSLWEESAATRLVFLTMLSLKDRDHIFRCKTIEGAARSANLALDDVRAAINVLESPDRRNSDQPHEGRRIARTPEGWLILNGQKYQDKMQEIFRRGYKARWMAQQRAVKKARRRLSRPGTPLPGETQYCAALAAGDTARADRIQDSHS
jgi:hypothetical protein